MSHIARPFPHARFVRHRLADAARRAVAWVMLAALMLQVAAFATGPAMAASAGAADRIEVCTIAGMVVVDNQDQQAVPSADRHGQFCAFCLPLLHGGSLAAEAVPVPPLPFAFILPPPLPPTADTGVVPQPLAGAASPQAPPFR